ncbi:OBERON-like protein [Silene latifolia]|uniref:OBERON-like protein n=1 Tax=Silene latifolia TaxID=37657 RepID=UPI003D76E4A7
MDPRLMANQVRESPTESASSRDTSPTADGIVVKKSNIDRNENDFEQSVVRRIFTGQKVTLRNIAEESVEIVCEKMQIVPEEYLEELKNKLRVILEGNGGTQQREEFLILQKLVQSRSDLTAKTLLRAHRVQLEILVALKMGIQAFLHPNVSLSQTSLFEIFAYKRCRNIACQNQLPVDDCTCEICASKNGFCNVCMCVICNKFDFEVNTCRWIGCDLCSHWTHTDCAIRDGLICMGTSSRSVTGQAEMLFRCRACNRTSELLGWVKDVFQHCAPSWNRAALMNELDIVGRIFRGSEDVKGRKLFWKCEELIEKMKGGLADSTACRVILMFFQELEADSSRNAELGEGGRLLAPQEACKQIAEVVQEAVRKMEMVADEKLRMLKKARINLETCDRELEDKAREVAELKLERQRRKQQIDELESIVKLKQAEADMFQLKADETRREAEMLQNIAIAKSEKSEEDYRSRYLKLKMSEAEAEKQYLFQKLKVQEGSRVLHNNDGNNSSSMYSNLQDAMKNA